MIRAVGLVEFNSIAKGIESADFMLKAAQVEALTYRTVCPGKYIALIWGDVAAVQSSVAIGISRGSTSVVDELIIPNIHAQVIPAINGTSQVQEVRALGVIETFSLASTIVAADTAVKAAEVDLIELRLGLAIGGKAFVTLTGDVGAVKAAIAAGAVSAAEKGLLAHQVVIPSPHPELVKSIF